MQPVATPMAPAAVDPVLMAIVSEIEKAWCVPAGSVLMRDRRPHLVDARHVAFWALGRAGLNPAQIARQFGLNHSTVVHGLKRVECRPEWHARAGAIADLAGAGGPATLRAWLRRGLPRASEEERRAVYAYAACTLLGWERRHAGTCSWGLLLVLGRPGMRRALEEALLRVNEARQIPRIDMQAARLAGVR